MKRVAVFLLLAIIICAGLFLWLKPNEPDPLEIELDLSGQRGAELSAPDRPPVVHNWVVMNGRLSQGKSLIRVAVGTPVQINIRSNQADELHVHGYDIELDLKPNQPSTLNFVASIIGYNEIELHHRHESIAAIDVIQP